MADSTTLEDGDLWLPSEFPYEYGSLDSSPSSVLSSSPVESPVSSTESESDGDEFLAGLTRRFSLHSPQNIPHSQPNLEVFSYPFPQNFKLHTYNLQKGFKYPVCGMKILQFHNFFWPEMGKHSINDNVFTQKNNLTNFFSKKGYHCWRKNKITLCKINLNYFFLL